MSDRTCPVCGETKDIKKFLNKQRRVVKVCTVCRTKERKRDYYRKQAQQVRSELLHHAALSAAKPSIDNIYFASILRELRKLKAQPKHLANKYRLKLDYGGESARTQEAYNHQTNKLNYFDKVEEYIKRDAIAGELRPLEFYLSNARLRNDYGSSLTLPEGEPNLENMDYYGGYPGKESEGQDRWNT